MAFLQLITFLAMCLLALPPMALAQEIDYEPQIKIFESAAVALHRHHPRVAAALTQYAHDQALWRDQAKVDKNEADDEKAEMLTPKKRKAHIKLLQESATLLRRSDPALSRELISLADKKAKRLAELNKL